MYIVWTDMTKRVCTVPKTRITNCFWCKYASILVVNTYCRTKESKIIYRLDHLYSNAVYAHTKCNKRDYTFARLEYHNTEYITYSVGRKVRYCISFWLLSEDKTTVKVDNRNLRTTNLLREASNECAQSTLLIILTMV